MKNGKIIAVVFLFVLLAGSAAFAADSGKMTKFEKMLLPRTIACRVGGTEFEGLLIGSFGKLTFVCLDRKLGEDMMRLRPEGRDEAEYDSVPVWLRESGNFYMKQKNRTFFAVQIRTAKQWDLDLEEIRVGDYTVVKEDMEIGLSIGRFLQKDGRTLALPSNYTGEFGFYVPSELLKPGAEILVGYEDKLESWTVPKR